MRRMSPEEMNYTINEIHTRLRIMNENPQWKTSWWFLNEDIQQDYINAVTHITCTVNPNMEMGFVLDTFDESIFKAYTDNYGVRDIVHMWFKIGGYADMTLSEFIDKTLHA